jgi:hypothetical protein
METFDNTLETIILDIERTDAQTIEKKKVNETFELWRDPVLELNLCGNIGVLLVRSILNKLSIDEHHVLRWRLDNKYRQYQVLNHYAPDCMAETISFSQILRKNNSIQKIRELCKKGFFLKSTVGDGTGRDNSFDRTAELHEIIRVYKKKDDEEEKWVLQQKLNFKKEFRIHTFHKELIPGLTSITEGQDLSNTYDAEEFVKTILEKLPDTILQGTLIGWDIGLTDRNEHYVIEANITGFHPEFNRGFQTSGYFGDPDYGSIMSAWLNNYFRCKYQISISSVETSLAASNQFYEDFIFFSSILNREYLEVLSHKTKDTNTSVIIYLGESSDSRLPLLANYLRLANFANMYYLIVNEENLTTINNLFEGKKSVKILVENTFFTKDQQLLIKELSYEKRKDIYYQHVLQIIRENSCFMI